MKKDLEKGASQENSVSPSTGKDASTDPSNQDVMIDRLHELLDPSKRNAGSHLRLVTPITCADGTSMSIQASRHHYCSPRDDQGPWCSVEIGYPSVQSELLMKYAEDKDNPTQTVYGWVPIEVVAAVIIEHGGMGESR